jgi:hypothetical protein
MVMAIPQAIERVDVPSRQQKNEKEVMRAFRRHRERLIRAMGREPLVDNDIDTVGRAEFGRRWGGVSLQSEWRPTRDRFYVVNTSWAPESNGEHWVGLYVTPAGVVYCYDSFGRDVRRLLHHVGKIARQWGAEPLKSTDDDAEQRGASAVCGHLSLSWLLIVRDMGIRKAWHV